MIDSQKLASAYSEELTLLLNNAVEQTVFESSGQKILQVSQLQHLYSRAATFSARRLLSNAQPKLDERIFAELVDLLRSLLSAYIVDGKIGNGLFFLMGGTTGLSLIQFTHGLIRLAAIWSSSQAAQLLCEWADGAPVRYRSGAVLSGLSLDDALMLGEGIHFEALPTSSKELASHLPLVTFFDLGHDLLGDLKVTFDCSAGPVFSKEIDNVSTCEKTCPFGIAPADLVDILCEVLSLSCNNHVAWKLQWSDCEVLQILGMVTGPHSSRSTDYAFGHAPRISQEHSSQVLELLTKRIDDRDKNKRIDLAISRWTGSKKPGPLADQFIELRIALEALYIKEGSHELGFRIANHGAWHLGSSFEERCQYQRVLHKAYGKASSAVHAGVISTTKADRDLLLEAQDLCRDGILKRLYESEEPNWKEVILGKER